MSDRRAAFSAISKTPRFPHPMRIADEFTVATPTGRAAQFGQGLLEDVAACMLLRRPTILVVRERQAREP